MHTMTVLKNAHQLRAGMIVRCHGGRFQVTANPVESNCHHPEGYWPADPVGPSDCVVMTSVCLEGKVSGYFEPGSEWKLQGNTRALFTVELA
jgi:hypothetical protein